MTVAELIAELEKVKNKEVEVRVYNQTLSSSDVPVFNPIDDLYFAPLIDKFLIIGGVEL